MTVGFPLHAVIVTAAGSSARFNDESQGLQPVKKEFLSIDGHTVLYRSVRPFLEVPGCCLVIVTCSEGLAEETGVALEDLVAQNEIPIIITPGGETRQASVRRALEQIAVMDVPISYVAIHDGARPWIGADLIINTLATATVFGGAAPAVPIADALKRIDENGVIVEHIGRSGTVGIQTPQIFAFPQILEAHRMAAQSGKTYIDDTEIFSDFGGNVGISEGVPENRKITWQRDIPDARQQIIEYRAIREQAKTQTDAQKAFRTAWDEVKTETLAERTDRHGTRPFSIVGSEGVSAT